MSDLYQTLIHTLHAEQDRKGEWHCPCQFCGKPSTPKNPHHSFNEQGFYCFVCGEGGSLKKLADQAGITEETPRPILPKPAPKKQDYIPDWKKNPTIYLRRLCRDYEVYPKWREYKPLSSKIIESHLLGYGVLPASKCKHKRLIVPLIFEQKLYGFRGRAIDCDCGKWLSSYGSEGILYNSEILLKDTAYYSFGDSERKTEPVLIVENPIDALMLEERGLKSVATLGVTMWKDEWTEMIKSTNPKLVVVVYDKDLAGNGASNEAEYQEMVAAWKAKNPKAREVPVPNGIKLVNRLSEAGVNARLYRWEESLPFKTDIGDLLCTKADTK